MKFKLFKNRFRVLYKDLLKIEGKLYNIQTNKKPSRLYWGNKLINFSIFFKKIDFMKLVVKSLKNMKNINFNGYLFSNLVLWYLMFHHIKNTFDNIVKSIDKYVIGENKFTRGSKFSFKNYVTFLCFNKGTSNQANLKDFIEDNFTTDIQ